MNEDPFENWPVEERRAELAELRIPPFLYKYRPIPRPNEDRGPLERMLVHNELWMANSLDLNDEFEGAAAYEVPDGEAARRALFQSLFERVAGDHATELLARVPNDLYTDREQMAVLFRLVHAKVQKELGMCSLTEDPLNRLMWGHYADKSQGVCIQLDVSEDVRLMSAMQVRYSDDMPLITRALEAGPSDEAVDAMTHKAADWGYEKEWRLFELGRSNVAIELVPAALSGVILGSKISGPGRDYVLSLIEQRRQACGIVPAIYQATRSRDALSYTMERVS